MRQDPDGMGSDAPAAKVAGGFAGIDGVSVPIAIACHICLITCMSTGRLAELNGVGYQSTPFSGFAFGLVALFFLIVPVCNKPSVRHLVNCGCLVAFAMWTASLCLYWVGGSSDVPWVDACLLVVSVSYRVLSITMSIQLNYYAARRSEAGMGACTLLITSLMVALFLLLTLLPDLASSVAVFGITLVSLLIMVREGRRDLNGAPSETSSEVVGAYSFWRGDDSECGCSDPVSALSGPTVSDGKSLWLSRLQFFASRVAWGAAHGTLVGLSVALPFSSTTGGGFACAVAVFSIAVFVVTLVVGENERMPLSYVAFVPVLGYLLILMCFVQDDFFQFGRMLGALTFLPWFIQECIQLPSYTKLLGMGCARFAYLEKMTRLLPYQLCQGAVIWLDGSIGISSLDATVLRPALGLLAFMLLTLSAATTLRHFRLYYPLKNIGSVAGGPEKTGAFEAALEDVASAHSLSPREREVFSLLAHGYSGPYIEKSLFISKGTEKTHAYRLYRKLGVASQDELIDLVSQSAAGCR